MPSNDHQINSRNNNMKKFIHVVCVLLLISACYPTSHTIEIKNAHMAETPKTFPAAAIFMTIHNNTDQNDRMIGFETDRAGRVELHTMALIDDVMRMRQVNEYDIPAGDMHKLKHMGDHIMVFDMVSDFKADETFQGIAIFEKAGKIPFTIHVKNRKDTYQKHSH